jgi:hypothetical protein
LFVSHSNKQGVVRQWGAAIERLFTHWWTISWLLK